MATSIKTSNVGLKHPEQFKKLIIKNGYNLSKLAADIGTDSAAMTRYVNGGKMRPMRAKAIAKKLNVDISDIFLV
ncbi:MULTISPECIES: helix-turn-helix domain-containing protein [Convivina]|uniref:HTH cro/C1-type domain-containing protein n=1 Tax=Convivina praedatoris TaxID=2880963 RepID=A0ABM9D2H0_9LACO|nr:MULTISPECIES: helix-turn-helix transcriptional regulator [Convivina]CAH1853897.1 hypothetical protein R078131_00860 [Convivina intestini]CAH1854521.1 hypothetical protein R077815_01068 [Convivina sp. LMG 32447]CAH1855867.1 hypothetical protein LMG032447_01182 [Convivina sp. LMG 32447]CAH1856015.1 hypothetical protein R078138_01241 [Convivina sp. LMG 32447]